VRSSSPATNSFAGGKTFVAGTVDLAAHSAAGTGAISFAGVARLEIEKAELTGHVYHNAIDFFGKQRCARPERPQVSSRRDGCVPSGQP